jgi:hypothetical protein
MNRDITEVEDPTAQMKEIQAELDQARRDGLTLDQIDGIVESMEKMVFALLISMVASGNSSCECPDTIVRLLGWRKK